MDIATLNAVIKTLKRQLNECERMLEWAVMSDDPEANEFSNMWASKKVTVRQSIGLVQEMLGQELAFRDEEAA